MFNISNQIFEKIQNVLFLDKVQSPHQITDVVASEVFYVLKQYFEIDPTNYRAKIHVQKNGEINIDFSFLAKRLLTKKENPL